MTLPYQMISLAIILSTNLMLTSGDVDDDDISTQCCKERHGNAREVL